MPITDTSPHSAAATASQEGDDAAMTNEERRERSDALFAERSELLDELAQLGEERDDDDRATRRRRRYLRSRLDEVTNEIFELHAGLVEYHVRRFRVHTARQHVEDFRLAGRVGLMQAIDTYDPERGTFSGWAFKQIFGAVLGAVRDANFTNFNRGDFYARPKVLRAKEALEASGGAGYRPSYEEIAAAAGVDTTMVVQVLEAPRVESLSQPLGDGGDELGDLIADPDADDFADDVLLGMSMEALAEHGLPELTARELSVLTRRYGLDHEPRDSLIAIGDMLGLSRETVRMDEQRALAKIKHPSVLRRIQRNGR